jgi:hypothetical protein
MSCNIPNVPIGANVPHIGDKLNALRQFLCPPIQSRVDIVLREISPELNVTPDAFFASMPASMQALVSTIRRQKVEGIRKRPSSTLLNQSKVLTALRRAALLDQVATLVDENLSGRSDMCEQFAVLLTLALRHLGMPARAVAGEALCFDAGGHEVFRWRHAWVRIGSEVVDGNVDSLDENPAVPNVVRIAPYWGPISLTPRDRRLRESHQRIGPDGDVSDIWWPDLRAWLDGPFEAI